jgi:dihydrolipoamide dehydrogenase
MPGSSRSPVAKHIIMLNIQSEYDVIVIGSGPSGCACAIRCGQLGLKTLCIDNLQSKSSQNFSQGLVTHPGSLETIILLGSANHYYSIVKNSKSHGINVSALSIDLQQMMARKTNILKKISQDISKQFSENNIDFIHGKAKLIAPTKIELISNSNASHNKLTGTHIILATESIPITIACAQVDNNLILDSAAALNLNEIPKKLVILGAGVLGLEIAGIWNRLGAETILLDAQESFLGLVDHQISREAYKIFTEQGLDIRVGTRVISTNISNNKVIIEYQDPEGIHTIEVDKLIVASGRKPNSDNLAAPEANLFLDENGFIHTDDNYRTNLPNIYAIGDLTIMGPMLTHKGIAEGQFVADQIANRPVSFINYKKVPNVIYTEPEVAWIGQSETALNAIGHPTRIGLFYLDKNLKAISSNATDGMIKIISCAKTETILGVQIISKNASELISEAALAMEFTANSEDVSNTMHPFPCFAEIICEASKLTSI